MFFNMTLKSQWWENEPLTTVVWQQILTLLIQMISLAWPAVFYFDAFFIIY